MQRSGRGIHAQEEWTDCALSMQASEQEYRLAHRNAALASVSVAHLPPSRLFSTGLLGILSLIGALPPHPDPLSLVTGGAAYSAQLTLLHTLVDLVQSAPADSFYAGVGQYARPESMQPHADPTFSQHVRLLHMVSNSAAASAAQQSGAKDGLFAESVDLFPQSILIPALATARHSRDKPAAGHKRHM